MSEIWACYPTLKYQDSATETLSFQLYLKTFAYNELGLAEIFSSQSVIFLNIKMSRKFGSNLQSGKR